MSKTWTTMTALAVVLILAALVLVACEEDTASAPQLADQPGISIDIDRSKPRPKMSAPKVVVPKAPAPKGGGRR